MVCALLSPWFSLNICSMHCVTMNPAKMLTEARATAAKPISLEKPKSTGSAAINAPMMTTLETASVTLISWEWRAGVTRQTT